MDDTVYVLHVDDCTSWLKGARIIFSHHNMITYSTRNANEALKALTEIRTPIDIIVTNITMPGIDGLMFLKKLKQHPDYASLPVVIHSAVSRANYIMAAMDYGALDYIPKGISHISLASCIHELALAESPRFQTR